jgi:hypothetical protein
MYIKFWLGSLKVRDHSEDLDVDERILKYNLGNKVRGYGLDLSETEKEPVAASFRYGDFFHFQIK